MSDENGSSQNGLDLCDLFVGLDDEGDALDPSDAGRVSRCGRFALRPLALPGGSGVLAIAADECTIRFVDTGADCTLYVDGRVQNLYGKPVELDEVTLVARGVDGRVLDTDSHWMNAKFSKSQELVAQFDLGGGILDAVERIDLVAHYDFDFKSVLAAANCTPPDPDAVGPARRSIPLMSLLCPDGQPGVAFAVRVGAFLTAGADCTLDVLVEVEEGVTSRDANHDLIVALRGDGGRILARETTGLVLPISDASGIGKVRFELPAEHVRALRRIDVAMMGTCRRCEYVGSFAVR